MNQPTKKQVETFFKLVLRNDLDRVKEFLAGEEAAGNVSNVNLICRAKSGDSAMHIASQQGHLKMLRFLIEDMGGSIEIANHDERTPLHNAVQYSHLNMVKYLIGRGSNVCAVKKADWTPLMIACTKKDLEIVKLLLDHGSETTFRNKDGWNALHIASREGCILIVRILLNRNSELALVHSNNGRIPLHTAVMHGRFLVTDFLLRQLTLAGHCNIVNSADSCQTTPLMDACRFGYLDIVNLLIDQHGANISLENSLGMNCLHIAAEAGQTTVINSLVIDRYMDVNRMTKMGNYTPLHFACRENHLGTVELLLKLGASPSIVDNHGQSCIELAKTLRKPNILKLLLQEKAA